MAVQKNKKSRSRRDMRRSHDKLKNLTINKDKKTKELHIRHNITKKGYYKGKKIINIKNNK